MKDKRNRHGAVDKSSSEQHFYKCAAIIGRQAGRMADEIQVNFEIFTIGCRSKYSTCRFV